MSSLIPSALPAPTAPSASSQTSLYQPRLHLDTYRDRASPARHQSPLGSIPIDFNRFPTSISMSRRRGKRVAAPCAQPGIAEGSAGTVRTIDEPDVRVGVPSPASRLRRNSKIGACERDQRFADSPLEGAVTVRIPCPPLAKRQTRQRRRSPFARRTYCF
jgi:hypothetical protein